MRFQIIIFHLFVPAPDPCLALIQVLNSFGGEILNPHALSGSGFRISVEMNWQPGKHLAPLPVNQENTE